MLIIDGIGRNDVMCINTGKGRDVRLCEDKRGLGRVDWVIRVK